MIQPPETLLDIQRITFILHALVGTAHLDGHIAEVGVYKGGTAYYLNKLSYGKSVYLFDTFEGIPMTGEHDRHVVGDFNDADFDTVSNHFINDDNITLIKGIFPESADKVFDGSEKFALVHLDADQYQSTLDSLKYFYDKMLVNGIIIFDDYKFLKGVDKALEEFFKDKPEVVTQSSNMQAFIIKQ